MAKAKQPQTALVSDEVMRELAKGSKLFFSQTSATKGFVIKLKRPVKND